jgi:predicted MFS family arabinose efflux permease
VGSSTSYGNAGFAAGALLAGLIADLWGLTTAIWVVAALTAGSGLIVVARMCETHSRSGPSR